MNALLFDLNGTLVDRVYAHVLAWQRALGEVGVTVDSYRLRRHVGLSGDMIVRFAQREAGPALFAEQAATVHRRHEELFRQILPRPGALPGAVEVFRDRPCRRPNHHWQARLVTGGRASRPGAQQARGPRRRRTA